MQKMKAGRLRAAPPPPGVASAGAAGEAAAVFAAPPAAAAKCFALSGAVAAALLRRPAAAPDDAALHAGFITGYPSGGWGLPGYGGQYPTTSAVAAPTPAAPAGPIGRKAEIAEFPASELKKREDAATSLITKKGRSAFLKEWFPVFVFNGKRIAEEIMKSETRKTYVVACWNADPLKALRATEGYALNKAAFDKHVNAGKPVFSPFSAKFSSGSAHEDHLTLKVSTQEPRFARANIAAAGGAHQLSAVASGTPFRDPETQRLRWRVTVDPASGRVIAADIGLGHQTPLSELFLDSCEYVHFGDARLPTDVRAWATAEKPGGASTTVDRAAVAGVIDPLFGRLVYIPRALRVHPNLFLGVLYRSHDAVPAGASRIPVQIQLFDTVRSARESVHDAVLRCGAAVTHETAAAAAKLGGAGGPAALPPFAVPHCLRSLGRGAFVDFFEVHETKPRPRVLFLGADDELGQFKQQRASSICAELFGATPEEVAADTGEQLTPEEADHGWLPSGPPRAVLYLEHALPMHPVAGALWWNVYRALFSRNVPALAALGFAGPLERPESNAHMLVPWDLADPEVYQQPPVWPPGEPAAPVPALAGGQSVGGGQPQGTVAGSHPQPSALSLAAPGG